MALTRDLRKEVLAALDCYNFPGRVWGSGHMIELDSIREVEIYIQHLLFHAEINLVREGLISIVCWGWANTPICEYRTANAVARFTDERVNEFVQFRNADHKVPIVTLSALRLPQLSRMAFATKVLAFMRPDLWVILDRKIARVLADTRLPTADHHRYLPLLSIPVSPRSASLYQRWVDCCRSGAQQLGTNYRPVDIERAIFQLAQSGQNELAAQCVNSILE